MHGPYDQKEREGGREERERERESSVLKISVLKLL
jgi:hypothetical protein